MAATSAELLGGRPLPRVLRERPLIFLFGPPGCGKSAVAARLCGEGAPCLDAAALSQAAAFAVRHRGWAPELEQAERLIVDGPTGLSGRPGVVRSVAELALRRAQQGRSTVFIEGPPGQTVLPLMEALPPLLRCTLVLRFPEGRGRRRFALAACAERGLPPELARRCAALQPWSYRGVLALLDEAARGPA